MTHTHVLVRCECGRVLRQCRCPGPKEAQAQVETPCRCASPWPLQGPPSAAQASASRVSVRLTLNLRQLDALRAALGSDFPELRSQVIELLATLGQDAARTGRYNEPIRLEVLDDGPLPRELSEAADAYLSRVRARIVAGAIEYGNRSFDRPSSEILGELSEESEDLAGWGFILWERQRRLARAAAAKPETAG